MKRLLLFLLLIIPALAKAQTPITPSWTRQATQIGILDTIGMTYSGQITKQYLGSTAWVRRYMINKADTNTFSATRYWTEHQPHIWYADQTVHGYVVLPDYNKGLVFAHSNITNTTDALTFNFDERNGGKFTYFGQEIFRMAGTGHSADDSRVVSSVPFATKPSGISKFYADTSRKILTGHMDGNGVVTIDTLSYDSLAKKTDTTLFRSTANSYSLAGMQTKINSIFSSLNTWTNSNTFNSNINVLGNTTVAGGVFINNGSFNTQLNASPTSNRIITLPDNSGAVALTIDMPLSGTYTTSATAQTTFTVTIGTTQANNTYKIAASPDNALSAVNYYITNKTTTTFDIVTIGALTGTVSFDWILSK